MRVTVHYTDDCLDNLIMTIQTADLKSAYTHSLLNVNNASSHFTAVLSLPPLTKALTLQKSLLAGAFKHLYTSNNNAFHIAVIISCLCSNVHSHFLIWVKTPLQLVLYNHFPSFAILLLN